LSCCSRSSPDHVLPFREQKRFSFRDDEVFTALSKAAREDSALLTYLNLKVSLELQKRDAELQRRDSEIQQRNGEIEKLHLKLE
jgi:hypothetical protein